MWDATVVMYSVTVRVYSVCEWTWVELSGIRHSEAPYPVIFLVVVDWVK